MTQEEKDQKIEQILKELQDFCAENNIDFIAFIDSSENSAYTAIRGNALDLAKLVANSCSNNNDVKKILHIGLVAAIELK